MWNSNPRQLPELTDEEFMHAYQEARFKKGQAEFNRIRGKQINGEKVYPEFTAKEFREFIIERGNARALDRGWKKPFVIDADNENIVKALCLYFTGDERFEGLHPDYSLRKGIMLVGPTGVGKTVLMELCSINPSTCFTKHDCQEIAEEYADAKKGGKAVLDYYTAHGYVAAPGEFTFGQTTIGRLYDDLGMESLAKHFGNERNVMANIIEGKYRLGDYWLCHFTSNHLLEELGQQDMYGPRAGDRLNEMSNVLQYPASAKSRRK